MPPPQPLKKYVEQIRTLHLKRGQIIMRVSILSSLNLLMTAGRGVSQMEVCSLRFSRTCSCWERFLGLATRSVSPGSLLDMQSLRSHSHRLNPDLHFSKSPSDWWKFGMSCCSTRDYQPHPRWNHTGNFYKVSRPKLTPRDSTAIVSQVWRGHWNSENSPYNFNGNPRSATT